MKQFWQKKGWIWWKKLNALNRNFGVYTKKRDDWLSGSNEFGDVIGVWSGHIDDF